MFLYFNQHIMYLGRPNPRGTSTWNFRTKILSLRELISINNTYKIPIKPLLSFIEMQKTGCGNLFFIQRAKDHVRTLQVQQNPGQKQKPEDFTLRVVVR